MEVSGSCSFYFIYSCLWDVLICIYSYLQYLSINYIILVYMRAKADGLICLMLSGKFVFSAHFECRLHLTVLWWIACRAPDPPLALHQTFTVQYWPSALAEMCTQSIKNYQVLKVGIKCLDSSRVYLITHQVFQVFHRRVHCILFSCLSYSMQHRCTEMFVMWKKKD